MAMQTPNIKTAKDVVPMIYAYTTPGITYHEGYTKIGYTEQKVEDRVYQQTHTAGVKAKIEWQGNAVFDDGSGETFDDHAFHAYLRKNDIKQPMDLGNEYFDKNDRNEWFYITPKDSRSKFYDFRLNRGIFEQESAIIPYILRAEQEKAVSLTKAYKESHKKGEFLWNAKPRFGKTLAVYDFMKRIGAKTVLIVTNRPAIANSWYSDYAKFIGRESKYFFVSDVDCVRNKKNVISYDEFAKDKKSREKKKLPGLGLIYFASLQDLKGSVYFGGKFDKLQEIKDTNWDLLVIDEAHEGVDTYKTDVAFDRIKCNFTLHLSGTPFKALANNKFNDELFTVPAPEKEQVKFMHLENALRIRSLTDPTKKMSKSSTVEKSKISLSDEPKVAAKKIMSATTDSEGVIRFDMINQPGISNLLQIESLLANRDLQDVIADWAGQTSYGDLKRKVADSVEHFLADFQARVASITDAEVEQVLASGEKYANDVANAKLAKVQHAIGLSK